MHDKLYTFNIGDNAAHIEIATDDIVKDICRITGDINPIHIDDNYASGTVFKKRVAHGIFCLGMLSNVLGTKLPGEGCILLSQTINYKKPVYIDDAIITTAKIIDINEAKRNIYLSFQCVNQQKETVCDGNVTVKLMKVGYNAIS